MTSRHQATADAIATLLYPYAEVVLHDMASHTVAYIANNFSKRSVGDDSGLDELPAKLETDIIGPYEKLNWDGRRLRSISVALRDEAGRIEGLMCINMDISVFESARAALNLFLSGDRVVAQPDVLFQDDWQERINQFIHRWLRTRQLSLSILQREHKRELVEALQQEGAFRGRNAANYAANVLGMGRATIYKYLKEMKEPT
ncbi:MAG: PAS domain-containing protein [Paludibacterium sp.]|uniref:helix-turn-helix transcriptional regulator n=1 Tax=Paludibacterium sp. TaxID=1917523 RepID=UPI0025CE96E4|nr:PAS domain-containing protein [Paludibacterium sp.]MBV8047062.1 PAS domain-containing protein [Paludibacterium sp.]MBV8646420.1 PAS domain-containing protein [Paludibacterium sp.]